MYDLFHIFLCVKLTGAKHRTGHSPTYTMADNHWPNLMKLLPQYMEGDHVDTRKLKVQRNPHIVSWYYNYVMRKWHHKFHQSVLGMKDWWYRTESKDHTLVSMLGWGGKIMKGCILRYNDGTVLNH